MVQPRFGVDPVDKILGRGASGVANMAFAGRDWWMDVRQRAAVALSLK